MHLKSLTDDILPAFEDGSLLTLQSEPIDPSALFWEDSLSLGGEEV